MAKKKQMDDYDLQSIIGLQIHNAMGYLGGDLSEARRQALQYYLGEPLGNEVEGRSQVISTDVMDVIEWILPDLIEIFTKSGEVVKFIPQTPQDVQQAEQETDYVNWVAFEQNQGFLNLYTWFKDALMQKNGIVKVWWDETEERTQESYDGLTDDELALMMQDDELSVTQHTERQTPNVDPQSGQVGMANVHDVVFTRTKTKGRVKWECLPPEEFVIARDHHSLSLQEAVFCAHRTEKTRTELIEMGFDKKLVNSLPAASRYYSAEEIQRLNLSDERNFYDNSPDKSTARVTIWECYVLIDYDGDGIAERRKITVAGTGAGNDSQLLDNVPFDYVPFVALTPIPLCHKFFGLSIADITMPLQEIKTAIWRQMLDNLYLTNNQRTGVDINKIVNLNDVLISRPGGIVRTNGTPQDVFMPVPVQPLGDTAFEMMQYIDTVREGRTGVSQMTMGVDGDVLNNNKGDATMGRMMTAAQKRVLLIARVLAETGVKELFQLIHQLLCKHQNEMQVVQLRNQWVQVNPQDWKTRTQMTVHVGLGTGDQDKKVAMLMQLTQLQQMIAGAGGLGVLLTPKNIYNTVTDLIKFAGFKDPSPYLQDPDSQQAQQAMQQQQQQSQQPAPELQIAQMETQVQQQAVQQRAQQAQMDMQLKVQQMQAENQANMQKMKQDFQLQLQQQAMQHHDSLENMAAKLTELQLKYSHPVPGSLV